jgi:D-tagatose-1,6-bisphosphate aldolase subunit GatZ/KbaZ
MNSTEFFLSLVREQKSGNPVGIHSVCSSHPAVVDAAVARAHRDETPLLIESTSNQVNQFGGYTGMTPEGFRTFVFQRAEAAGLDKTRILLGGDHLGPVPFQGEDPSEAMDKACGMVRSFVEAGFVKIHLDTSIPLGGETSIGPEEVAARCARLCRVCEDSFRESGPVGGAAPVYIIGTEVPVPGGSDEVEEGVQVTSPEAFRETVEITGRAFRREGLEEAWERVIAVVVQPGVEFGDQLVLQYRREDAAPLSAKLGDYPGLVFEAHSADYQTLRGLRQMVEDGFSILKVGPGLTFAYREAVFLLCAIENELLRIDARFEPSGLIETLDQVMVANPRHWIKYYGEGEAAQSFKRKYSLFDRVRYYWGDDRVQSSLKHLLQNLRSMTVPMTLLSQFFPVQHRKIQGGSLRSDPEALVLDRIDEVLSDYAGATRSARKGRG